MGLTEGELERGCTGFVVAVDTGLAFKEAVGDLTGAVVFDWVVGLRVGVEALDVDLDAVNEGRLVGVEDRIVDLEVGVEDLEGAAAGLAEDMVAREVGVEDLEGLDVVVDVTLDDAAAEGLAGALNEGLFDEGSEDLVDEFRVGRPVGVPGLELGPPDEDGLRSPPVEVFNPGDEFSCLDDVKLFLPEESGWGFASFGTDNNLSNTTK